MNVLSCVRCVSCLLKALKAMHCVKRMLTAVIVLTVAAMGISLLTENKKAVKDMVRAIKKKVL